MDEDTLLNAVHVPTDAGRYAEVWNGSCRIPDGWGAGSATARAGIESWPFSMTASRARAALLLRTQRPAECRTAFCDTIAEAERVSAITRARCRRPRIRRRRDKWRETLCAAWAKSLGCPSNTTTLTPPTEAGERRGSSETARSRHLSPLHDMSVAEATRRD